MFPSSAGLKVFAISLEIIKVFVNSKFDRIHEMNLISLIKSQYPCN